MSWAAGFASGLLSARERAHATVVKASAPAADTRSARRHAEVRRPARAGSGVGGFAVTDKRVYGPRRGSCHAWVRLGLSRDCHANSLPGSRTPRPRTAALT